MHISTIEDLNSFFAALNQDFRAARINFGEYVEALNELKQAAAVAELPFIFSANDLSQAINHQEQAASAHLEPYFVCAEQLDAEPSEEEDSGGILSEDDSEFWEDEDEADMELDDEIEFK